MDANILICRKNYISLPNSSPFVLSLLSVSCSISACKISLFIVLLGGVEHGLIVLAKILALPFRSKKRTEVTFKIIIKVRKLRIYFNCKKINSAADIFF